jgi:hypothetical protein
VVVGATASSLAADRHEPRQDDQCAKTKPPAGSCLRFLDQSLELTRALSEQTAACACVTVHAPPQADSRVGRTSRTFTDATHSSIDTRISRWRTALDHARGKSDSSCCVQ